MTIDEMYEKLKFEIQHESRKQIDLLKQTIFDLTAKPAQILTEEPYILAIEAAAYIRMPIETLYKKAREKEIPNKKSGPRKYLFKKSELDSYLAAEK